MSAIAHQMKIRLPAPLKLWLEQQAHENGRSKSAEIVFRLEVSRVLATQMLESAAGRASQA